MDNFFSKLVELFSTPEYIDSLLHGFLLTIQISYFALLIGLILGTVIALVDTAKKSKWMVVPNGFATLYHVLCNFCD